MGLADFKCILQQFTNSSHGIFFSCVTSVNHLIAVANNLWEVGEVFDIPTLVAGILHDTIEDTETSPEELEAEFGAQIRSIVEEVTDDKSLPKQVRKQLQIEHAGEASHEARCVKLADKISNVQDLVESPPVEWSLQRRIEYVNWAEAVVNRLRGTNEKLEQRFDALCQEARQKLEKKEKLEHG
jgi:guanosine-3',5'-bis(diphosphate) 3'-pyrophosphohydrolase